MKTELTLTRHNPFFMHTQYACVVIGARDSIMQQLFDRGHSFAPRSSEQMMVRLTFKLVGITAAS